MSRLRLVWNYRVHAWWLDAKEIPANSFFEFFDCKGEMV